MIFYLYTVEVFLKSVKCRTSTKKMHGYPVMRVVEYQVPDPMTGPPSRYQCGVVEWLVLTIAWIFDFLHS